METVENEPAKKKSKIVDPEDVVKQEFEHEQSMEESVGDFRKQNQNEGKIKVKKVEEKPQRVQFKLEKKKMTNSMPRNLGKSVSMKPGVTIGRALRQLKKETNQVGPFTYQAKKLDNSHGVKFPKTVFASSTIDKNSNRPGPGYYHKNTEVVENKQNNYTIGWKYGSIFDVKNKVPGPGQYEDPSINLNKSRSKAVPTNKGFGTSNRFREDPKSPGPGDYQTLLKLHNSKNKKRTISNASRQSPKKQEALPGPGNYESVSFFEDSLKKNRGMSIGQGNNSRSSVPDLTAESYNKYTIPREFDAGQVGPGFTIGQQKRKFIQVSHTPSPQDYSATIPYSHSPSARIIKTTNKPNEALNGPGPGTYDKNLNDNSIHYSFNKSKSISQIKMKNQFPGIGRYDISTKYSAKGLLFNKEKKYKPEEKNVVGVGDYNIAPQPLLKKGFTIPKA